MGLTSKSGAAKLREEALGTYEMERGEELVSAFLDMIDRYYSTPEIIDDELNRQIAACKYEILRNPAPLQWPKKGTKVFTPSSANSCRRELYHRLKGDPRDEIKIPPHQGRWKRLGTLFGEMIQMDLLFIEKHYKRIYGEAPPFTPAKIEVNGRRFPFWENFAKKIHHVKHRVHDIYIMGQPDGILEYRDGSRIGLEIKSKQTGPSATTVYSLPAAKEDHVAQTVAYSLMFEVDEYLIVYGNLAKKSWDMTTEEYEKNPDVRAFYVRITEADRRALLDKFADVLDAVKTGIPPRLELDKWTFNNYKTACALSLTDEEYNEIKQQVARVKKSGISAWKKASYIQALEDIQRIRKEHGL